MNSAAVPRVFSIPPGAPFLNTLADALLAGDLVGGLGREGDPMRLADTTIYVPTRRAARALRGIFVQRGRGGAAILPTIHPLGDFDEDAVLFEGTAAALELAPPVAAMERLLELAPLVQAWKRRLPAHVASMFAEDIVVPASTADSIWLARDLAALMDEIETEGVEWTGLTTLVAGNLASWWQVTLEFLKIVTTLWPQRLAELVRSNPAAHRSALIDAETARLLRVPPAGPVIAAGSTGSIPATARLLAAIARLPRGAVVLPGLDLGMDEDAWRVIGESRQPASAFGHPQFGLKKLLGAIGVTRAGVAEIGRPVEALAKRGTIVAEALRPAETTDRWVAGRDAITGAIGGGALAGVSLVEAANEREEALAIAVALRAAIDDPARHVALVTSDRELARRVSGELLRFGIAADDSGGTPLERTPPGALLALLVAAAFQPGDPLPLLGLMKHPLFRLGRAREQVRRLVELIELVALRGGTGRPDMAGFARGFDERLAGAADPDARPPFWLDRLGAADIAAMRALLADFEAAMAPLVGRRGQEERGVATIARATVEALEAVARGSEGDLSHLYGGDAGESLAALLRELTTAEAGIAFRADDWPDVLAALAGGLTVKPSVTGDSRVSIWGTLEARLQNVDLLVVAGLNEGSWPRKAEADRFMSRVMKTGLQLEPPERRIGLAAHDFMMATGAPNLVLTRSARAGDAPAVASRWLQRLLAIIGPEEARALRSRGNDLLAWARTLDAGPDLPFVPRPCPAPPLEARPKRFSVTDVETLRRDPYAIYARKVLRLRPLDPLLRDPGAAERGSLFHAILHRFTETVTDPSAADAGERLFAIARGCFDEAGLPDDVRAVWWPRFQAMSGAILAFERARIEGVSARFAEVAAVSTAIGETGATLSGRADRIDARPGGIADILDYKTGSTPSKRQAHTLVSPQLALEGALLRRGAFTGAGRADAGELAYVRLRANGEVELESILAVKGSVRSGAELSEDAWSRLEKLIVHYGDPAIGYLSRALPFREGATDGDYDHLARVLEWSAGGEGADGGGEGE